jgi:hypothetical protein
MVIGDSISFNNLIPDNLEPSHNNNLLEELVTAFCYLVKIFKTDEEKKI